VRRERWGPRTIDLDYLLDEAGAVDQADLTVPHSQAEQRAFVLAPLAELRPDLVLPSGRPIGERLAELLAEQPLRRLEPAPTIAPCRPPS
jgi:2-amino-4-hydroxy-6-hydroxymethyldihydropteridine diphosphokinase